MDVLRLTYFLEVARKSSFTQASKDLHVSQPTLSKMVKQLEEELGVALFDRTAKKIRLTDAGEILQKQAQYIIKSIENIPLELSEITQLKKGTVKIGLPPMIGARFFPRVISEFNALYPLVNVRLYEYGAEKIAREIEKGDLDIGAILMPVNTAKYDYFDFAKKRLMLLVHPEHQLAGAEEVSLEQLKDDNFIFFSEEFTLHNRIYEECIRSGFQPKIVFKSSQWDFISEMVAAKMGVALLPETICQGLDKSRIKVLPMAAPIIYWHIALVWRKEGYLTFAARTLLEFARIRLVQLYSAATEDEGVDSAVKRLNPHVE